MTHSNLARNLKIYRQAGGPDLRLGSTLNGYRLLAKDSAGSEYVLYYSQDLDILTAYAAAYNLGFMAGAESKRPPLDLTAPRPWAT